MLVSKGYMRLNYAVAMLLLICGCGMRSHHRDPLAEVFASFIYVGEFPGSYPQPPPSHGAGPLRAPESFERGRLYVFHRDGRFDHVELGRTILPERMRSAGLTVIGAPKSWGDVASLDDGVLLWQIEFKDAGRRGFIYTSKDRQLRADFIVALSN